jgi:excisionase family DNA binding protein
MITMEELLTVEDVARILRLHIYTVRELLKTGELEGFKIGRQWKIKQEALRQFIDKQSQGKK